MASPDTTTSSEIDAGFGTGSSTGADATAVVQSDGETEAVRPRVDVAFAADDPQGRLVGPRAPLPTGDAEAVKYLGQIAEHLAAIRVLLEMALT